MLEIAEILIFYSFINDKKADICYNICWNKMNIFANILIC
ncbi:hypothetical protein CUS_6842 [Ruminococcus albus 8]|uniref:Uncharacterized protein n=1 Tax=Ruminococcus albus 8 TaxID=246199 RepID=E9SC25_RUMAL|nr:hypothetical protein CUS_6842 [Ruminococcus albus 8]